MTSGPDPPPDLLDTGPPPAPRRWAPRGTTAAGRRRWARAGAVLLGIAAVLLALRATDRDSPPRPEPVADAPPPPTPPYDRLPGRTPIPEPTRAGDRLGGVLPAVGGPGEAAALRAAGLVLGRYCTEPAGYTLTLAPDPDWSRVSVLVFTLIRSGDPPRIALRLRWTGTAYAWTGLPAQLRAC